MAVPGVAPAAAHSAAGEALEVPTRAVRGPVDRPVARAGRRVGTVVQWPRREIVIARAKRILHRGEQSGALVLGKHEVLHRRQDRWAVSGQGLLQDARPRHRQQGRRQDEWELPAGEWVEAEPHGWRRHWPESGSLRVWIEQGDLHRQRRRPQAGSCPRQRRARVGADADVVVTAQQGHQVRRPKCGRDAATGAHASTSRSFKDPLLPASRLRRRRAV